MAGGAWEASQLSASAKAVLTADVIDRLRAKVPAVMTWTVNDAGRARELLTAGVDGITSDLPEIWAVEALVLD